jgi:hypothetical protein
MSEQQLGAHDVTRFSGFVTRDLVRSLGALLSQFSIHFERQKFGDGPRKVPEFTGAIFD